MTWLDGSWDYLWLNDTLLPGRCVKLDVNPKRDVKQTQTPGYDGPTIADQGYAGSPVDIAIECWRAWQAEELMAMLGSISPQTLGAVKSPQLIYHPITAAANIEKIYIVGYKMGMPSGGIWTLEISAAQWFPQPKKAGPTVPKDGGPLFEPDVPPPDPKNLGADFP